MRLIFKTILLTLLPLCFIATTNAGVVVKETPLTLPGGTIIDSDRLILILRTGSAALLDTRSTFNYGKGHIAGAKSSAYQYSYQTGSNGEKSQIARLDVADLPADKSTPIVVYSHGVTGWKSYNAALSLIDERYKDVMWFRGGLQAWMAAGNLLEKH